MIDSHHHLWRYTEDEYGWIPAGSPLQADFLAAELEEACTGAAVDGTVVVQARQSLEETDWLLDLARASTRIRGVVGWLPLAEPDVAGLIERYAKDPHFVGARHVLQAEPDEYFRGDDFHAGLGQLAEAGLAYDLLCFQRQLPAAIDLVDRQKGLRLVVDHIAKPAIRPGRIEPEWRLGMQRLAEREQIAGVKFSGVVTEFPPDAPLDDATIRAYFDATLELFGPERVMFGTDWPVSLLRLDSYRAWADAGRDLVRPLSPAEQRAILHDNALRVYGLA